MSKDRTLEHVGKLLPADMQRDAIHIAVAPVIAGTDLEPGKAVGVNVVTNVAREDASPHIGIVDPYLQARVKTGERCFVFLYPGTITSLRHEWTHPAFEATESQKWIRNHADDLGLSYAALMQGAEEWLRYGEHMTQLGSESWRDNFLPDEFWRHYTLATGELVPSDKRHSFFSCSC